VQQGTTVVILMINVIWAVIMIEMYGTVDGVGTIFQGDCNTVRKYDSALHGAINALSTLLLGASNYCMQILVAPTRQEVDRAHAVRSWLDIGVPSIRNFRRVNWKRGIGWVILALSSSTLHLM
jgi:hypothetical protein